MTKLKNIVAAMILIVTLAGVTNAQTEIPTNYNVNSSAPFAVQYLGIDEDYLVFKVTIQSPDFKKGMLEIADKYEGPLYASNFSREVKVKTLKIEKREGQVLNFTLVLDKKTYSKAFSVNTTAVEKTTVSESDLSKL